MLDQPRVHSKSGAPHNEVGLDDFKGHTAIASQRTRLKCLTEVGDDHVVTFDSRHMHRQVRSFGEDAGHQRGRQHPRTGAWIEQADSAGLRQPRYRGDKDRSTGRSEELAQLSLGYRIKASQGLSSELFCLGQEVVCHEFTLAGGADSEY